ncbi:hypothetical protein GCM10009425_47310 [Pseudomonas asuensis]|uniref:Uncharacterized protein n=1 Tax=Pseudomonas asuensis TaxID=1825787 RepID=A0ABQ2H382_9PSED|nr:hypothetical protein GCM10009425_47310 [Pseudomonas asuensis]
MTPIIKSSYVFIGLFKPFQNAQAFHGKPYGSYVMSNSDSTREAFALNHGPILKDLGYDSQMINCLASRPAYQRNFILAHGRTLKMLGYDTYAITNFARQSCQSNQT